MRGHIGGNVVIRLSSWLARQMGAKGRRMIALGARFNIYAWGAPLLVVLLVNHDFIYTCIFESHRAPLNSSGFGPAAAVPCSKSFDGFSRSLIRSALD